jgi:hypothetical protein
LLSIVPATRAVEIDVAEAVVCVGVCAEAEPKPKQKIIIDRIFLEHGATALVRVVFAQ